MRGAVSKDTSDAAISGAVCRRRAVADREAFAFALLLFSLSLSLSSPTDKLKGTRLPRGQWRCLVACCVGLAG